MPLTEGKPPPRLVEPLGRQHDRASFSCGKSALDQYLKQLARQDARRHVAAPFVLVPERGDKTILGYYTLSSFAVDLADLPQDVARQLPAYPNVPITLLGRLAVDQRHAGQGFGEFLLMVAPRIHTIVPDCCRCGCCRRDRCERRPALQALQFHPVSRSPKPPFPSHANDRRSLQMTLAGTGCTGAAMTRHSARVEMAPISRVPDAGERR
jgi:GNAT superfamily N-acetyltransferase